MLNALTIILLFAAAWAVSRLSAIVARKVWPGPIAGTGPAET